MNPLDATKPCLGRGCPGRADLGTEWCWRCSRKIPIQTYLALDQKETDMSRQPATCSIKGCAAVVHNAMGPGRSSPWCPKHREEQRGPAAVQPRPPPPPRSPGDPGAPPVDAPRRGRTRGDADPAVDRLTQVVQGLRAVLGQFDQLEGATFVVRVSRSGELECSSPEFLK